jgi:hypothetical protein
VASSGGANLLLWFRFERGDDGMKRCRKIKWWQRACLALWKESVA